MCGMRILPAALFISAMSIPPVHLEDTKLSLLFTVWRHGERAPSSHYPYPTDPYKNFDYPPNGPDALLPKGERRMCEVGRFLRERYGPFLGDLRNETAVWKSTPMKRALRSGMLVAAGMFPSTVYEKCDESPQEHFQSDGYMGMLLPLICPANWKNYETIVTYDGKRDRPELLAYLSEKTGHAVKTSLDLLTVADVLRTQEEYGLILPKWTECVYPQPIISIVRNTLESIDQTDESKRLLGGRFLSEMVGACEAWRDGRLPADRRVYGYSGHDTTIISVLRACELPPCGLPTYGTTLMIELRENKCGDLGLKFLLRNDTKVQPHVLRVAGCDEICPLDKFTDMFRHRMIPTEEMWEKECGYHHYLPSDYDGC